MKKYLEIEYKLYSNYKDNQNSPIFIKQQKIINKSRFALKIKILIKK